MGVKVKVPEKQWRKQDVLIPPLFPTLTLVESTSLFRGDTGRLPNS